MKITMLTVAATSVTSAATLIMIALPATAHAESKNFQSPSGNIACYLDSAIVECDISEHTYQPPPRPPECQGVYGNRVTMTPGKPAAMTCHGDTTRVQGEPTLNYGQTISVGTFTCASEAAGIKCTDTSGHYFRLSKESVDLG
jgi:hypothetical protein